MSSATFSWKAGQSPKALEDKLDELEDALDEHLEDAMDDVVKKISADASRDAPYESGWLSSHIRGIVLGWVGEVLEGAVGTNVYYGPFQEYGQEEYDVDFTANPYLRPAIDDNREWARKQFEQAVEDAVNEVFD